MSDQTPELQSSSPSPAKPTSASAAPNPRLVTVNAVRWPNILEFTHLFRSFRLAINPAKLFIALLALTLIYGAGRLFDLAWGPQVYPDEITHFISDSPEAYRDLRTTRLKSRQTFFHGSAAATFGELKASYLKEFNAAVDAAHQARLRAEATPPDPTIHFDVAPALPTEVEQQSRKAAADALYQKMQQLNATYGKGIFQTFLTYETDQFNLMIANVLSFVGISPASSGFQGPFVSGGYFSNDSNRLWRVVGCIANITVTGPRWLFTGAAPLQWRPNDTAASGSFQVLGYRALYLGSLSLWALFSLVMLAFAGAAICRLSALELAGIERAPLQDVFLFAIRRLGVFIKTPLAPFVILLAFGIVMAVIALLGAIPFIGPVLIGLIFFVFLGIAFVLMLLLLGVLGGFHLLYPAIAVEDADAFDAMSRSFAYVYARPWRLVIYTLLSLVYGAITFLFVSFVVYLIFLITHTFVGWGMNLFGSHFGAMSGVPALQTIWPEPQFLRFTTPVNWYAMNWPEAIGSFCMHIWFYFFITAIWAYVVSYYFSSHTILYLLLRRSVDGQNLTDVHLEEKP
jgi:hypothetical protein